MNENPKLRRIRLRFGRLKHILREPIVDLPDPDETDTLLKHDGDYPQVSDHPDRATVFLYVPWFDYDKFAEAKLANFIEWAKTAQLAILNDYPESVFDPDFRVLRR